MPQACSICIHPGCPEIDRALVAGESLRNIAQRSGTSRDALQRHKAHIPAHLSKAAEAEAVADAGDLIGQVRSLQQQALALLTKAEAVGDYRTALQGVREARSCIELLLEVEGELDRRGTVNVIVSPQWIEIRAVLIGALEDHPDARLAVAGALASLDTGNPS